MLRKTLIFILLPTFLNGPAQETMTKREKLEIMSPATIFSHIYENPAMTQLQRSYSISSTGIIWSHSGNRNGRPYVPAEGSGSKSGSFLAQSYLKHNNSTLCGFAGYTTGKIKSVKWCETSDYRIVYPYILGDNTVGDMKKEIYRFGGSVSSSSGRYIYGASISYDAGLYYRNIDPRPRNVTGLLKLAAGAGVQAGEYAMAVCLKGDKYKQTNSVEFMSELGIEKLYHLTGLGTNYVRFAGVGSSTYYTGWRYGASLDLHPLTDKNGVTASLSLTRFTFDNILSDINKLPMATVRETEYHAETGWKSNRFSINGFINVIRRLGNENIFGDATSGSYPQITTLTLYARNNITTGATAFASTGTDGKWDFSGKLTAFYSHDNQVQSSETARSIINNMNFTVIVNATYQPNNKLLLATNGIFGKRHPLRHIFTAPIEGTDGIINAAVEEFNVNSRSITSTGIDISATIRMPRNLALKIAAETIVTSISNQYSLSASILF